MRNGKIQVRLGTLMLLIVPISIAVFFVNRHYELGRRPIKWKPYSDLGLAEELESGNTVIVFLRGDFMATDSNNHDIFESSEFRREFHTNSYAALESTMNTENGMHPLLEKHRFTNLMIFKPGVAEPLAVPAGVIYTTEALLREIREYVKGDNKKSD